LLLIVLVPLAAPVVVGRSSARPAFQHGKQDHGARLASVPSEQSQARTMA
jgi:hypothetical protein